MHIGPIGPPHCDACCATHAEKALYAEQFGRCRIGPSGIAQFPPSHPHLLHVASVLHFPSLLLGLLPLGLRRLLSLLNNIWAILCSQTSKWTARAAVPHEIDSRPASPHSKSWCAPQPLRALHSGPCALVCTYDRVGTSGVLTSKPCRLLL